MEIVETRGFTKRVLELLGEESYRRLQTALVRNPTLGAVIPGCGGLRKVRAEAPGRQQGKRGGNRVVYLVVPETSHIHMIAIFGKDEQDDLGAAQKKILAELCTAIREQARHSTYWRKPHGKT